MPALAIASSQRNTLIFDRLRLLRRIEEEKKKKKKIVRKHTLPTKKFDLKVTK